MNIENTPDPSTHKLKDLRCGEVFAFRGCQAIHFGLYMKIFWDARNMQFSLDSNKHHFVNLETGELLATGKHEIVYTIKHTLRID